jgi:hypothetical protein
MLLFATSVFAGDVDDCFSNAGVSCENMQVTVCPAGDFEYIYAGCGGLTDYIWIQAMDSDSLPIPGIPWTDYWLNACNPLTQLCICVSPIAADSLTGLNGKTTFSGRIRAGGCALEQGIWWAIQGKPILAKPCDTDKLCLDIVIKSPDLTGGPTGGPDCILNLSDLIPFGKAYNTYPGFPPTPTKEWNACCDYNDDNLCNLSDFAYWGTHYLHKC